VASLAMISVIIDILLSVAGMLGLTPDVCCVQFHVRNPFNCSSLYDITHSFIEMLRV